MAEPKRNVEQMSLGFYSQPKDQNHGSNNAIRLLYDRWNQFFTQANGTIGFVLVKLDHTLADKSWPQTG